jgi:hypothetical protein
MKRKRKAVPRSRRIPLGYLGLVVALWNELESQVKTILVSLAPENRLVAAWLVMDLQIGPLINAARLLSREMEWLYERVNVDLRRKRGKYKLFEPFAEHVDHFLTGVDILREHRNYYVHNAINDTSDPHQQRLMIYRISARGKVSLTSHPIDETALENLVFQIGDFLGYGDDLAEALRRNTSKKFSERPSWPEKPPLPGRLKTSHITFQDVMRPPQSFREIPPQFLALNVAKKLPSRKRSHKKQKR